MRDKTSRDAKGYYEIPELGGIKLPSVTTIQGVLRKFWLEAWQIDLDVDWLYDQTIKPFLAGELPLEQFREMDMPKVIADAKRYHKDVSGEAMDFGSRIHKALDEYHKGAGGCDTDLIEYIKPVIEWEELVHLKVIESEGVVYSRTFQYAGTRDLKAEIRLDKDPLIGVIDYKTRNGKGGKHLPVYPSDKEQVAAYVLADEEMSGDLLDFGGVLIINRETKKVEPHIYLRPQLIQPGMAFIALAQYFNITRRGK